MRTSNKNWRWDATSTVLLPDLLSEPTSPSNYTSPKILLETSKLTSSQAFFCMLNKFHYANLHNNELMDHSKCYKFGSCSLTRITTYFAIIIFNWKNLVPQVNLLWQLGPSLVWQPNSAISAPSFIISLSSPGNSKVNLSEKLETEVKLRGQNWNWWMEKPSWSHIRH